MINEYELYQQVRERAADEEFREKVAEILREAESRSASLAQGAPHHEWTLGCRTCQREAEEALAELVRLKDGPRDAEYDMEKPGAWDRARAVVALAGLNRDE